MSRLGLVKGLVPAVVKRAIKQRPSLVRQWSAGLRMRPSYLIIGAQRCGTTSLYNYLGQHPEVVPSLRKEVHYFDLHYGRGWRWYLAHFPMRSAADLITGEASPYYLFHPLVAERVARDFPAVKLVVLLRNPIERAYSQYHHEVRRGVEGLSFAEAIAGESARLTDGVKGVVLGGGRSVAHQSYSYLARGVYVAQLRQWREFFPAGQMLIIENGSLRHDFESVWPKVLAFLGLSVWPMAQTKRLYHQTAYDRMDGQTRRWLTAYFAPHNAALYEYLGVDFGWE